MAACCARHRRVPGCVRDAAMMKARHGHGRGDPGGGAGRLASWASWRRRKAQAEAERSCARGRDRRLGSKRMPVSRMQRALPAWLRSQPIDGKISHVDQGGGRAIRHQPTAGGANAAGGASPSRFWPMPRSGHPVPWPIWDGRDSSTSGRIRQGPSTISAPGPSPSPCGLRPEAIVSVQHVEGSGCYGHNPADDVAFDAAWLAREAAEAGRSACSGPGPMNSPGRTVQPGHGRVIWRPIVDAQMVPSSDWRHTVWSNGHSTRPGRVHESPALLGSLVYGTAVRAAARYQRPPARPVAGRSAMRCHPMTFPPGTWSTTIACWPCRCAPRPCEHWARLLNVFAVEQFLDELAHESRQPIRSPTGCATRPIARARAVIIDRASSESGWGRRRNGRTRGGGMGYRAL